jgi:hypothetical protein
MSSPWFRLQADFYLDRDLRRAGPDARLCWPFVLCVLKQARGVASDSDLDPFALADLIGGDVAMWEGGISRLRDVGLLVETTADVHRGRGKYESVTGWAARSWQKFQPDPRPRADRRTVPNGPERSPGLNGAVRTVPNGPEPTVSVSVSNETLPLTEQPPVVPQKSQKASKSTHTKRQREAVALDDLWQDLSGAKLRPGTAAEKKRLARWGRYLKDHSFDELAAMVRALAKDEWWRGGNRDGKDLFREGPAKFLNDAEKVEARVKAASGEVGAKAWLATWRGAVDMFTAEVRGRRMAGGRESFAVMVARYDKRALPIPADVLDMIDRRTGA